MRLIDADALHDALKAKQLWVVRCGDKHNEGYTYDQVHFAIDDAPSIDICFCRECKHCSKDRIKWSVKDEDGNWIDTKCNLCRRTKLEVSFDDFCSYGERKESE